VKILLVVVAVELWLVSYWVTCEDRNVTGVGKVQEVGLVGVWDCWLKPGRDHCQLTAVVRCMGVPTQGY